MSALKQAIAEVGGATKAAEVTGRTVRAVYKWLDRGALPRTEFTGETRYAELLAEASGGKFTAEWLRQNARPEAA